MPTEIKVPILPESVADAVIASWYKKPGETIRRDEVLVDLETDKVILEVPSLIDGVVSAVYFEQGDTVTAEQILAIIEPSNGASVSSKSHQVKSDDSVSSLSELSRDASISPSARKLMLEHDLSASDVTGSGKSGRVLKEDVMQAIKQKDQHSDEQPKAKNPIKAAENNKPSLVTEQEARIKGARVEQRVPMTRLRSRIAERLLEAQHNAAILTTFNEVNLQPIMDLRSRYQDQFIKEHDVKLGFMSFFIKASIEALKKFPAVNASIDGDDVVYHGFFDIGVAVSGANGLVVPILKDADMLSLADIEKEVLRLAGKARDNSLTISEITGGTFTITNGGVFGSMLSTPILNPPQSAILGMHTIKERAMVVDGEVVVLPMMYLALSYDHRIIDGREAVQFLVAIRDLLEDPSRMLLGYKLKMSDYDVIVIGAGPAGYVAAIRCAQLGLKTACVDEWQNAKGESSLGGTCLNVGCIPSKALLESSHLYHLANTQFKNHGIVTKGVSLDLAAMMARKNKVVADLTQGIAGLFKANGVELINGHARLMLDHQVKVLDRETRKEKATLSAKNIIIASGSSPMRLDCAKITTSGHIHDSAGGLEFDSVPKRLGIIGAGVIGLELGSVWSRLGSEVVLLEAMDEFLSIADGQISKAVFRSLKKQKLDIRLNSRLLSAVVKSKKIHVEYEDPKGSHKEIFDRIIVAVGRKPNSDLLFGDEMKLELDERRFVLVNEFCETSVPGLYAIGDVVRGPMLAHKGSEEGIMVAERIAGEQSCVNYDLIPSVIYTHPEVAWVGKTEEECKSHSIPYKTGVFPIAASGRARAMAETEGMIKIISHEETDRILGVHIFSAQASELIAIAVTAMSMEASSEDVILTMFAHPTLSESFHEAALSVHGRAIHIKN